MWPGLVIFVILVGLLIFLKRPAKPTLTDGPTQAQAAQAAHLPNPFLMDNDPLNVAGGPPLQTTGSWKEPVVRTHTEIRRPYWPADQGRTITMPMIRWAQAQFERGQMYALNPREAGQRFDDSYWRAVEILRSVEGGGMYLAPSSNAAPATFERYQRPFGQSLPPMQASPVEGDRLFEKGPATPATLLMSLI